MKSLFLILMTLGMTFGTDPNAIKRKVADLTRRADQALASNFNTEAESHYQAAIEQCDLLPPEEYHCKTDLQWKLGQLYGRRMDVGKSEAVYKERLHILVAHQKFGARPDLDIGIALFDLQSALSSLIDASRDADETTYMQQARRFYERCKADFPDLRSTCDRRLADVEGLHGCLLSGKMRFDEAAPFLKAVTDRPDSAVRNQILVTALMAQARPLLLQGKSAEAQVILQRVKRLETSQK